MIYDHLMLDLETFSTMPSAMVISVGGCFFNMNGQIGPSFNLLPSLRQQQQLGRTFDHKTVQFWMTASDEAKKPVLLSGDDRLSLDAFESSFSGLIERNTPGMFKYIPWARGKEFDLPILKDFWVNTLKHKTEPWYFRNARCCREQLRYVPLEVYERMKEDVAKEYTHLVPHNSEHDAIRQAVLTIKCEDWIQSRLTKGG